jgi:two-component system, LytTR family, sensor kinase
MPRRFAWTVFVVWTVLALLSVAQTALFLTQRGTPVPWDSLVPRMMLDWYTCAVFTPAFIWLARRYPLDTAHWRRAVPLTLALSIVCVVLKYSLFVPLQRVLFGARNVTMVHAFTSALAANFFIELMIFWAVIGVVHAYLVTRRLQEREQLATALRARLTEARLEALQGQLRPHFLFNTLHGISTLIHTDPDAADRMVVQLGELLRASLDHSGAQEIRLDDELALLERYLAIMQTRFHDRLQVELDVDPETRDALVPHFILQPLVENAIEHGIARRAGAGRIRVTARADGARRSLRLAVEDDGPGAPREAEEGVGLTNTRLRLQQLYGHHQSLLMTRGSLDGVEVDMVLPLRTSAPGLRAPA